MSNKFFAILFTGFSSILFSQQPSISPLSNRLEFSTEMHEYFSEETNMPSPRTAFNPPKKLGKVKIQTTPSDDGTWELRFQFPEPVTFKQEIDGDSLFFEFNQPIDSPDLEKAQESLGFLLKKFANGYNTLNLIAKKPVFYNAEAGDSTFILTITPDACAPIEASRSLKVAEARLLVEEREYQMAISALWDLQEEYPCDKDTMLLAATLEGLLPRWQREMQTLSSLRDEHPRDEDLQTLMDIAYSPHSSYVLGERQVQRTIGLAVYQVWRAKEEAIFFSSPFNTFYGGVEWQLYRGHISSIVDSQGNSIGFRGSRNQGTLFARNEWADGKSLSGMLYAQEGAVGAGAAGKMLLPWIQGDVEALACWHRPYWAIFETLAFHGREDLFKIHVNSVYSRYFNWSLEGGMHRVGITGTPNGFTSVLASSEIFINLVVGNPIISLNYGFDAEYITQQKEKLGVNGEFNPVPYTSFENHSVRGYLVYQWRDRWNLTVFGGETFNRLGLHARTYGISLKYAKPVPRGWEIELSAYRFPSTIVQGATGEYYTATFIYRF